MASTIRLTSASKAIVKRLKRSLSLSSADGVINYLAGRMDDILPAQGRQNAAMDAPEDNKKKKKRVQFFSYAALAEEPSALKYYTGLKPNALAWVWEELNELVCNVLFFLLFCSCALRAQYSLLTTLPFTYINIIL